MVTPVLDMHGEVRKFLKRVHRFEKEKKQTRQLNHVDLIDHCNAERNRHGVLRDSRNG
jgi:uncharacterized protein (UPF0335 family)